MEKWKRFLKRKDIVFTLQRYGIDALGAMAQGLFCTLLVGTILNTLGTQCGIGFLSATVVTVGAGDAATAYTIGGLASAMVGPAMAIAIGYALKAPPMVLFSLAAVGWAANAEGGAGGPLAVYFVAIVASECGKLISKETRIDILITPVVTILVGIGLSSLIAAPIGTAAKAVGEAVMWATELQPFFMGILVSVIIGIALTLPISSAAICAAFGLTGLAMPDNVAKFRVGLLKKMGANGYRTSHYQYTTGYMDAFVAACFLPHTDARLFPNSCQE